MTDDRSVVFKTPMPPPVIRTASLTESDATNESWDSEVDNEIQEPMILGIRRPEPTIPTKNPKRQTPMSGITPLNIALPPHSPVVPQSPVGESSSRPQPVDGRPLRFGMSYPPAHSRAESKSVVNHESPYYRKPIPWSTRSLRIGASDVNNSGYAPLTLPDNESTTQLVTKHSRSLCDRTMKHTSALPSSERYMSDIADTFTHALNERTERLQSLLTFDTNMARPTAQCDNYAVQSRDLMTQVQLVVQKGSEWILKESPDVLDATARQYELEGAAAVSALGPDAETIEQLSHEIRRLSAQVHTVEKNNAEKDNAARQLRGDRDRLIRKSNAQTNEIATLKREITTLRSRPNQDVPLQMMTTFVREQLETNYDADRLATMEPLLADLEEKIFRWRLEDANKH